MAERCLFLDISTEVNHSNLALDVFLCSINFAFGFLATTSNALVLRAITRTPSLKSPSNTLLLCLAASDLMVGLLVQPSLVFYRINIHLDVTKACKAGLVFEIVGWFLSAVTFFTLFAITFERFVAISCSLRYRFIITGTRIRKAFGTIVFTSAAIASCRLYVLNNKALRTLNAVLIPVNSVILCAIYIWIFLIVRQKQAASRRLNRRVGLDACSDEARTVSEMELKRFTKSTMTMALIGGAFLLCYAPFFCTMVAYLRLGEVRGITIAYNVTLTTLFMNSAINPFLYCFRIRPIQRAMKRTFRDVLALLKIVRNH